MELLHWFVTVRGFGRMVEVVKSRKKKIADFKECQGAQSLKIVFNEHRRKDMNTPNIN